MPVRVEASQSVTIDYDGKRIEKAETRTTALCDGPNCQKDDSPCPGTFQWSDEKPEETPDGVFRMLVLMNFEGGKKVFFSKECLRDFMRNYVPPLSPREKAKIDENNRKVEADENPTPVNPAVVDTASL